MVLVFSHTGFKSVLSTLLFSLLGHIQRNVSAFLIYFRYQKSLVFSFYQVETDLNQNFLPRFSLKLSSRPFSPACCLLISIVVGGGHDCSFTLRQHCFTSLNTFCLPRHPGFGLGGGSHLFIQQIVIEFLICARHTILSSEYEQMW